MAKLFPHFRLSERLGAKIVDVDAATVRELLAGGSSRFGAEFESELRGLTVFVNGRNIRYLQKLETPLGPRDEVFFVAPAVGG